MIQEGHYYGSCKECGGPLDYNKASDSVECAGRYYDVRIYACEVCGRVDDEMSSFE